jgi:uncharacterized Zn finger protein
MPNVRFEQKQALTEWWECDMEVPQDVIDQGKEAMESYIRENAHDEGMEYNKVTDQKISEDFLEMDKIRVH